MLTEGENAPKAVVNSKPKSKENKAENSAKKQAKIRKNFAILLTQNRRKTAAKKAPEKRVKFHPENPMILMLKSALKQAYKNSKIVLRELVKK